MNLSRVLHPSDYQLFTEHLAIAGIREILKRYYRYEHEHRKWEYGLALKAVLDSESRTVLDVGGGGAILSPLLSHYGCEVTQLDLDSGENEIAYQNQFLSNKMKFMYGDFSKELNVGKFDSVVSISTIEHVHDDNTFFINLLEHANKNVFLTMDFFPTGETFSKDHLRTYSKERIYEFCSIAQKLNFTPEFSPYIYRGNYVYDYTFASLHLTRNNK